MRVLAAVLFVCASCTSGPAATSERTDGAASAPRVVLIGIDGADWLAIDALVQEGALPTFAELKSAGRTGVMFSTPPLVSPIIWTTIATGLPPEKHGILDFMLDAPAGGQQPVRSVDRRGPALWNLFSAHDRTVAVIGWWATWPAEHVRGTIVSDRLAPQLLQPDASSEVGMVWPAEMSRHIAPLVVRPQQIEYDDLNGYVPLTREEYSAARSSIDQRSPTLYANPLAHLAAIVASTRTYSAIAVELLRTERPDFLAVYLEGVDSVSHLFVRDPRRGPTAIEHAYRDADELIRRVAEASAPETLVMVCSDHGFYPPTAAIADDPADLAGPATAWHRPYGIVAAAPAGTLSRRSTNEAFRPGDVGAVTPLDIAPTLLHAAALPVTVDMPGHVVTALLPTSAAARTVQRVTAPQNPEPAPPPAPRGDAAQAWARLQALGYVGSTRSSLARQNLAEILYRRGDLPGAEREARTVLQTQPANVTAKLWLAKSLADQSKRSEALAVYESAMRLPGAPRLAIVEAVDLALSSHAPDRAQVLIAASHQSDDAVAALAVASGDVADSMGQHAVAERRYRAALKADPRSFDAVSRLFERLVADRRAREALALVESATKLVPDSPQHLALLGEARLAAHDPAGAETALTHASRLAPESARVRLALGRAQLMGGKSGAAIVTLVTTPSSIDRDALLGAAYSAESNWPEATKAFVAAAERGSPSPALLNGLGWAQMKMGQTDQALAAFTKSLNKNPNQPEIRRLVDSLQGARRRPPSR